MGNFDFKGYVKKLLVKNSKVDLVILLDIMVNWREIVGDFFYKHSVPYSVHFRDATLFVACDDNIVAQELYLLQKDLIKCLNQKLNFKIKRVKTIFDMRIFRKFIKFLDSSKSYVDEFSFFKLPSETERKIERILSKVNDENLKESLRVYFRFVVFRKNKSKNSL